LKANDFILFAVVFGSIAVAVCCPELGSIFQSYFMYCMMMLLFLSFLRIDFRALLDASTSSLVGLTALILVKLFILPSVLYFAALFTFPEYAIPVLLLSGISTGVVAPFIAMVVDADVSVVLRMVVITSLIVPFSLPSLVKLLAGAEIHIPLGTMVQLLSIVIFIPIFAVLVLRQLWPTLLEMIFRRQFPLSLTLFALINLGVFSKYSSFFFQNPESILVSIIVAYVLAIIYFTSGWLIAARGKTGMRVAAGISLALMNNVLVIVFSSQFFGPLSPMLAAMYMFPFFTLIVPMKLIVNHLQTK
jgi:BASS family bile acid:Na+ symporter